MRLWQPLHAWLISDQGVTVEGSLWSLSQTHPVNFLCGRKPEYPRRKPTTFGRALTDSFRMRVTSASNPRSQRQSWKALALTIDNPEDIHCLLDYCLCSDECAAKAQIDPTMLDNVGWKFKPRQTRSRLQQWCIQQWCIQQCWPNKQHWKK